MVARDRQRLHPLLERGRELREWAEREIERSRKMQRHWPEGVSFLRTELDTGLAFSRLALRTSDSRKAIRTTAQARLAYDTASHFLNRVALTPAESKELAAKFVKLRVALAKLGH